MNLQKDIEEILEKYTLSDTELLGKIKDRLEFYEGFFPITSLHRDDLENLGFDVSNISDETMQRLSEKMADDYCNQMFHQSLEIIAEYYFKIPKKDD